MEGIMSSRIDQILEVLHEIRKNHHIGMSSNQIINLRNDAVATVTRRRGLTTPTTVADKFQRQLRPEINCTEDFDQVVFGWLGRGSTDLRRILLAHAVSFQDKADIEAFFN
jgi:hypothetical protein